MTGRKDRAQDEAIGFSPQAPDARAAEIICQAIRRDDLAVFSRYADSLGAVRFGRFPTLSLIYLYHAKKLEKAYESRYLRANSWQETYEPLFLSVDFRKKAGRTLRLYRTETVSPLEMLLVLDKPNKVKKLYPLVRLSNAQAARLSSVWAIKYSLSVKATPSEIFIDKRPLSYGEKKRYLLSAVGALVALALIVSTPFVVNVFVPFINVRPDVEEPQEEDPVIPDPGTVTEPTEPEPTEEPTLTVNVTSFSDVDFTSQNAYVLQNDTTAPEETPETVKCTIDGGGFTVTAHGSEPVFGRVEGTVKNMTVVGVLSGTIHGYSLLAEENAGTVENVTARLTGEAEIEEAEGADATSVTVLCKTNARGGVVKNCECVLDLTLRGTKEANATFAGIASTNAGEISGCRVTGAVRSTDCDLAGACESNSALLSAVTNACDLSQTSDTQGWSPMCAGIVVNNTYLVRGCVNEGAITAVSTYGYDGEYDEDYRVYAARAAGIAAYNAVQIEGNTINRGKITATSKEGVAQGGGIAAYAETKGYYTPTFVSCRNEGEVTVSSERASAYAGGIFAYGVSTNASSCVNTETASVESAVSGNLLAPKYAIAGGIAGYTNGTIASCENAAAVRLTAEIGSVYAGGVLGVGYSVKESTCSGDVTVRSETATEAYVGNVAGLGTYLVSCAATGGVDAKIDAEDAALYVGGIVGWSKGYEQGCRYSGTGTANAATCYVGGIVGITEYYPSSAYSVNYYAVYQSVFTGDVRATGKTCYVGGIAGETCHIVHSSGSGGAVKATGETCYVGGIAGRCGVHLVENNYGGGTVFSGKTLRCLASASVTVDAATEAFSGGVTGYVTEWSHTDGEATTYFGGGAEECYFTGTLGTGENTYRGTIVGGCDASVYANDDGAHFKNNYYVAQENPAYAVGAYKNEDAYAEGSGVGATAATIPQLENDETYRSLADLFTEGSEDDQVG